MFKIGDLVKCYSTGMWKIGIILKQTHDSLIHDSKSPYRRFLVYWFSEKQKSTIYSFSLEKLS